MTVIPPFHRPLLPSLPLCLHAGVLSVSRPFLFMVQGFYLPKMIPLWRHEARQRGEKKNLIKEGIICCQPPAPAPAELGHRENTNGQKEARSKLERCQSCMLLCVICRLDNVVY